MTEISGIGEKLVLSAQLQLEAATIQAKNTDTSKEQDKKETTSANTNRSRGKIAKVSKLFSAVSHSRSASKTEDAVKDSDDIILHPDEVEMFET